MSASHSVPSSSSEFKHPPGVLARRGRIRRGATAVVTVDMINHQIPREADDSGMATPYFVNRLRDTVVPNAARALRRARELGVPVVHLRVGYALPDASDVVLPFREALLSKTCRDGSEGCRVIDELAPVADDLSLLKSASGGFNSSTLATCLRNMGVENVIYLGVLTNACVLLTAAAGFDLGYNQVVVSDACAAMEPEIHDKALDVLDVFAAKVATTDEVLAMLDAAYSTKVE